ncbi:anoctamin-1-like isoform X3 [Atheta coriaria]|uniref:anoctamin-1-like isoform X3 n=1 Tax=Dalotia coriaria TaxID=877792 RepID=UPI0031F4192F
MKTTLTYTKYEVWSISKNKLAIDFVLVYEQGECTKRDQFKKSLEEVGLILEEEPAVQNIKFLKIHVPDDVLQQYAEILKLRMPLILESGYINKPNIFRRALNNFLYTCNFTLDEEKFPPRKYHLTSEYVTHQDFLYDKTSPDYFNSATRITVASYILEREKFGNADHDFGIKRLLSEGVYKAAYPLHDGSLRNNLDPNSLRKKLFDEWASFPKLAKFQPIDEIKDYFGVKIALYYEWLGFYTHMLIPAAIVGFLCVLYGLLTMNSDQLSEDICTQDVIMCPLCDKLCPFWELKDTCVYSKISYIVDNPVTIFFAVFMSIWSALYLELWKRYSAGIAHRWGLTGFSLQCEPPRPEYLNKLAYAKKEKLNVITALSEPVVPFWKKKLPAVVLSSAIVIVFMLASISVVFGIVIYRMSLASSESLYGDETSFRIYVVPVTAGIINLVCIVILNTVYFKLAYYLTDLELPRSQTEFEESLTLKIYMFQFINFYTSIFYIAFIKGKFVGYPAKYNTVLGIRQEECQPGGCLIELTIQLAIIMIGKQTLNNFTEFGIPLIKKMLNKMRFKAEEPEEVDGTHNQWTDDYKLLDLEPQGLLSEYLEMVVQYGFVTIFVTAFPLAPLFALINNVFEMRLDAKKMIKFFRRPVPKRVKNIGIWYNIMNLLCRISIVSNGFIIAFSSQFIPKLVYNMTVNKGVNDVGFLNYTLASFDVNDFIDGNEPEKNPWNVTVCYFSDYRNSHDVESKYKRPLDYWHIMTARLAFLVVYQNFVGILFTAIQYAIPDMPKKLKERIQREAYQINESIIKRDQATHKHKRISETKESLDSTNKVEYLNEVDDIALPNKDQNADKLHRRTRPQSDNFTEHL